MKTTPENGRYFVVHANHPATVLHFLSWHKRIGMPE
jgi:hypothetical protein